jgi:hypothetical protein
MEYTTLGKTGLKVSVAGLGCGGFSRLGLPAGKTEDEAVHLVCEAGFARRSGLLRPPRSFWNRRHGCLPQRCIMANACPLSAGSPGG